MTGQEENTIEVKTGETYSVMCDGIEVFRFEDNGEYFMLWSDGIAIHRLHKKHFALMRKFRPKVVEFLEA